MNERGVWQVSMVLITTLISGADNRCTQVRHEGAAGDALSASAHTEGWRRGALLRP